MYFVLKADFGISYVPEVTFVLFIRQHRDVNSFQQKENALAQGTKPNEADMFCLNSLESQVNLISN